MKRRLYEIFSSGHVQRIEDEVDGIWKKVIDMQKTEADFLDLLDLK